MSYSRREAIELANLYGSANCWTGTTGTLATVIWELLRVNDAEIVNDRMTRAAHSMEFAVRHLRESMANANAVESIVILQLIETAAKLEANIKELQAALPAECN